MSPLSGIAVGALGALAGGLAVALFGPQLVKTSRPAAKSALKAALLTMYAAQVRSAEDLYAEAKSEVTAEIVEAALAAAQANAATAKPDAVVRASASAARPARQRSAVKRSRVVRARHG